MIIAGLVYVVLGWRDVRSQADEQDRLLGLPSA
jgi:hypothetical protein